MTTTNKDRAMTSRMKKTARRRRIVPTLHTLEERITPATVSWDVDASGAWEVASNWRDELGINRLPAADDDVIIDRPAGTFTVTHSSGANAVKSLTINDPFTLSGGTLVVTGNLIQQNATTLTMTGGILGRATVAGQGGAVLAITGGRLDGVTLGTTILGVPTSATVQGNPGGAGGFFVSGGLTFANDSLVDLGTGMFLDGDQTLGGAGEIRFRGSSGISNYHQTIFGPGLTIHRDDGSSSDITIVSGSITNRGTIRADVGGQIRVGGNTALTNAAGGVLAAEGGGTLSLLTPSWSNAGQLVVNNGTLNLGGSFTTAGLGTYTRTGGTINLTGLLDNTGSTFSLDATTGSWNLASNIAELRGGNLVTAGGATLVVTTTNSTGKLNGVTLGATVGGVPASATVRSDSGSGELQVSGGLTFTNGSKVDLGSGMVLVGDQTLGGDGEIRFRAAAGGIRNFHQTTIGPGLTIHSDANSAAINMISGSITNQGTIRAAAGQLLVAGNDGTTFTNAAGGVLTTDGGTLSLTTAWSNAGQIVAGAGTINLGNTFTTAALGTLRNDGGIVNLTGTLLNTGSTLALNNTTGSLTMTGGTIVGGRISTAGDAQLIGMLTPGTNTLSGVTLAGAFNAFRTTVTDGLTLEQGLIIFDRGLRQAGAAFLTFNGTQTLGGAGAVVFTDTTFQGDALRASANATLTVSPGVTIRGGNGSIEGILNQGTIAADGGGTLTVQRISNFSSGALTGGSWQVSGNSTLRLIGVDISTNAADILVDGANARLFSDGSSTKALAGLAANTPAGRLRLLNGANLTTSASNINNQGSLTVGAGSTLLANTVTVDQTGTLAGSGTVTANLVNHGQVRPGTSPGILSVNGSYTQGATGRLDVELGGTSTGSQYDRLSISGQAILNGTLAVRLIDGFGPANGQRFEVMTFADHIGTFSTVTGLSQGRFPLFNLTVNPANVELNAVANGSDLSFESFQSSTFPSNAMPGQSISVTYTIKNLSEPPVDGNWIDSVYLSRDGVLDPSDALLTRVEHQGGVAGLGSYTETATAPLPALVDGGYRVIVVADSRGLASDGNRGNNRGVSAQTISVTVPLLALGTPVNGTIAPGQDLYYRLFLPPGRDVTVAADFGAAPGAEVYLRYLNLPDRSNFDQASAVGDLGPRLLLANPSGGSYYVLIHGRADAAGPISFTLSAAVPGFKIVSFSPGRVSNQWGSVQLELIGSEFTPQTTVTLKPTAGAERGAEIIEFFDGNLIRATFNLTGLPVGNYQVIATDSGSTAVADRTLLLDDAAPLPGPGLEFDVLVPPVVRVGRVIDVGIVVTNQSMTRRRPLLVLRSTNVSEEGERGYAFRPLTFGQSDSKKLTFYGKPKVNGAISDFNFSFGEVPAPEEVPTDWDTKKNELRPDAIPADAWDAIWPSLKAQLGGTLADFLNLLDRDESALARLGVRGIEANRIVEFELLKANGQMSVPVPSGAVDTAFPAPGLPLVFGRSFASTIAGHYRLGRLGRGWVDTLDISISEDNTGQVTVRTGAAFRFFYRQNDGSYLAIPGDRGTLAKVNNAFQIREATGEVTAFRSDGLMEYVEDANGNRLTAGYTGSQLTRLTHSNGSFLMLVYNAQGRLGQVTQANGDLATYDYDATGEHLLRVTTTAGVTEYTYTTDTTGPRAHALASITFPDGTHLFFQYNNRGWLAQQEADGGVGRLTFTYGPNSVSATNLDNQTGTVFYDQLLRPRQVQDPLGRIARLDFDLANDLASVSAAGAGQERIVYDKQHNPTSTLNPLGESHAFTYDPAHNRMDVFTDALGHTTDFDYDARGNPTAVTYADGSSEKYGYDTQGNLTRSVDRLGQTITYTYNSRGQTTRKDLPGGAHIDYTYNSRGNLETAVDASGTTRLEYLDPQDPDQLTKITHPSGRFLQYTYTNGRRTQMVDESGFTVNYAYDPTGRPEFLRDGSNNLIVQYHYDAAGRLFRETNGNGTATAYGFSEGGLLRTITHYAPDASVQSQLAYTYDDLGRRRSATTAEGTTNYDYDGAGRLTSVSLPDGQVIIYAYDAAGNRTMVTDSGVVTSYTVNALNQYTALGGTSQTFDAAGNLVSTSGLAGSNSYRYDAEGRLTSQVTPQGTWTYEYDVFGSRIASSLNGVRTQYLVDPAGNVVAEYDGNGNLQAHYVHGFGLTSRVDSTNASAYYQFDAVGNTTALTGSGGAVLNSYSYLPFGEALTTSETVANPFEFVGAYGVMREGSGIDYMRNRWYAPEQGRFTQADPIGLAGGVNVYAYVGNNPASLADPSGLAPPVQVYTLADTLMMQNAPYPQATSYSWEAQVAAQNWWQARDAYILNSPLSPPPGTSPMSASAPTWSPSIAADPLARTIYGNQNYSQYAAQVEGAAAEQAAAQAAARGAAGGLGRMGTAVAVVEVAKGVAAIGLAALALYEAKEFAEHGELPPGVFDVSTSKYLNDDALFNALITFAYGSNPVGLGILGFRELYKTFRSTKQVDPAIDPNDIVGPGGFGPEQFIRPNSKLPYTINFQNIPSALGPAAEVVVTHPLDTDLDLDTFELGAFGFGDVRVSVPAGRQFYRTRLDLRSTRGVFVDVVAGLDRVTRTVTWRLQAIDPETLDLPVSPFVGFLPPDKVAPEGQGFVSFTVRAKPDLPSGTRIDAQARIVFDTNAPIDTNVWINTLDIDPPSSSVGSLPAVTNSTSFTVNWSGVDDAGGSGIVGYDVFVSDNGGAYELFRNDTLETSAVFPTQPGHTYSFYSIATDGVGHQQTSFTPVATTVGGSPGTAFTLFDDDGDRYTLSLTGPGQMQFLPDDRDLDGTGPIGMLLLENTDSTKSRLTVKVKKGLTGDGRVSISEIEGTGLKSITARASNLIVGIDLTGPLGNLKIRDILAGATVRATGTPTQRTSITAHAIEDNVTFNLGTHISSFTAAAMGDGSINAPSIGRLIIKGDAKNKVGSVITPIVGNFEADLTLTGTGDPMKPITVGTARISGDVIDAGWNVTGGIRSITAKNWTGGSITAASLGKLRIRENFTGDVTLSGAGILAGKPVLRSATVGRTVEGSTIQVAGTVSNFRAGEFVNSSLLVGYTPTNPGDPFAGGTFAPNARLVSFRVLGIKGVADPAFENSYVAATSFGTVSIKSIDGTNASTKFGLLADVGIDGLTIATPFWKLRRIGVSPILDPDVFGDFEVRVI